MKIQNPEWQNLKHLKELLDILGDAKIVGGAVRNALMGIKVPHGWDVDIACKLLPEETQKIAENHGFYVHAVGIEHGTIVCAKGQEMEMYEVTTLRADRETDGRHAKVEFIESWKEDAMRRDFTINALFSDYEGNVTDYVNGIEDIHERRLKFIGNPEDRIKEDYLRILRFFRFYAHYCTTYDEASLKACLSELNQGLKMISRERCTAEFVKTLVAENPWEAIMLMNDEIFQNAGLPGRLPEKIADLVKREAVVAKMCEWGTTHLGKIAIFDGFGELVLPKGDVRRITAIKELQPMYHPKDYILWINKHHEKALDVIWDGIIVKGEINEKVLPDIPTWINNRYPLRGQDILDLGVESGPLVSKYLQLGLEFFANKAASIGRTELLRHVEGHLTSK